MKCDTCGSLMKVQVIEMVMPNYAHQHPDKANLPMESETLLGYSSPPGHEHNDNCLSRIYMCENLHERKVSKRRTCSACDWKGRTTCFCHEGSKVDEWPEEVSIRLVSYGETEIDPRSLGLPVTGINGSVKGTITVSGKSATVSLTTKDN